MSLRFGAGILGVILVWGGGRAWESRLEESRAIEARYQSMVDAMALGIGSETSPVGSAAWLSAVEMILNESPRTQAFRPSDRERLERAWRATCEHLYAYGSEELFSQGLQVPLREKLAVEAGLVRLERTAGFTPTAERLGRRAKELAVAIRSLSAQLGRGADQAGLEEMLLLTTHLKEIARGTARQDEVLILETRLRRRGSRLRRLRSDPSADWGEEDTPGEEARLAFGLELRRLDGSLELELRGRNVDTLWVRPAGKGRNWPALFEKSTPLQERLIDLGFRAVRIEFEEHTEEWIFDRPVE